MTWKRDKPCRPPVRGITLALAATLSFAGSRISAQGTAVEHAIERAATTLGATPASKAPETILERARTIAVSGESGERGAALLLLGLAQSGEDFELLLRSSVGKPSDVAEKATIALGLLGTTRAQHELESRLEDGSLSDSQRAAIAFALGLVGDGDASSSILKVHALQILRRSRDRHAEELAACLVGMPPDEGRSVLEHVLSLRSDRFYGTSLGRRAEPSRAGNDGLVERLAIAAMASRFATAREWILVRQALSRDDDDEMRRLACWGLLQRGTKGLDTKLRGKIARDLERRLGDSDKRVAGLALVALGEFNTKRALARARRLIDQDRKRPRNLEAAFLVVGKHGEKRDEERMRRWQSRFKDPEAHAAWALAAAELARRIEPEAFPPDPDGTARFPLAALRAGVAEINSQDPLVRAAHALALTRLGDRESAGAVRSMFLTSNGRHARTLATAALNLDLRALDRRTGEEIDSQRLLGWSLVGTPQLWKHLEEALSTPGIEPSRREGLLTIAAIAIAGPRGDLMRRVHERVGPTTLPPTLRRIAGWLDPGRARAMMRNR